MSKTGKTLEHDEVYRADTLTTTRVSLSGWGGYPKVKADVIQPADVTELSRIQQKLIVRGQGRSYGDASISRSGLVMLSDKLNGISPISEDGKVVTAAGTTLDALVKTSVPQNWFPPVVPGTKYVSIGGCFATDIHGKNHHRDGSIADHISRVEMLLADNSPITCSPRHNAELFWATAGGMGLTGIVTSVTMQLRRITNQFMCVEYHQARDLNETFSALTNKALDDHYTVMWLDAAARGKNFGRSILMRAHHASPEELGKRSTEKNSATRTFSLNFDWPSWVLNPFSISVFNELYYRFRGSRSGKFLQHYDDFFFPLDRIGNWNRMYGRRGFIQYQCVVPLADSERVVKLVLEELKQSGYASFLSVLKLFGPANEGLLSFPLEGYTLTLDLPLGDPKLFDFLDRLDDLISTYGGRVYLAKDARLSAANFKHMYPRFPEWRAVKAHVDPQDRFQSDLSRRLGLTEDGN